MFTNEEAIVVSTIIIALETGGQVYGKGDWGCFGEAYQTTSTEHAISIGASQWMGVEALKLLKKIYTKDSATFKKLDTAGIYNDFSLDWSTYKVSRTSAKAKCIITIISSEVGIQCQKELLAEEMQEYAKKAEALGVIDHKALAECCNFHHHGGYGAMKRVIEKTKKPYTLDNLYAAVLTDTGTNQIGTYTARQKACYNMINKYWPSSTSSSNSTTVVKQESVKTTTSSTSTSSLKLNTYSKWTGYINKKTAARTWAGTENPTLKSISTLAVNKVISVCDTIKANNGTSWYYVCIDSKTYGFVPVSNVSRTKVKTTTSTTKTTTSTTKSSKLSTTVKWTGKVTADVLNVRTWAGTENPNLKSVPTIKNGTKVGVCDSVKDSKGTNWYYIIINNKIYGFVHSSYIKKI